MSWIALTAEHVNARLASDELLAIKGTGGGDGDRLSAILTQVTGYKCQA